MEDSLLVGTVPVLEANLSLEESSPVLAHKLSSSLPDMTVDAHDLSLVMEGGSRLETTVLVTSTVSSEATPFSLSVCVSPSFGTGSTEEQKEQKDQKEQKENKASVSVHPLSFVDCEAIVRTSTLLPFSTSSSPLSASLTWTLLDQERLLPLLSYRHPFLLSLLPSPLSSTPSLHPVLTDVCPSSARWGSPLWISGRSFSPSSVSVQIRGDGSFPPIQATVIHSSPSLLKVLLPRRPFSSPPSLSSATVVVSQGGGAADSLPLSIAP